MRFASPRPFQRVERAGLRREDVDDEREVVHQDPLGAVVSLDVRGANLRRAQCLFDGVSDCLHLPRALSGTQQKKSVKAGVLRRSRTTTSDAFLSSAARTALPTSPVHFSCRLSRASDAVAVCRFSVFVMQVICRKWSGAFSIETVLHDVPLDGGGNESGDRLAVASRLRMPVDDTSGVGASTRKMLGECERGSRPRLRPPDGHAISGRQRRQMLSTCSDANPGATTTKCASSSTSG